MLYGYTHSCALLVCFFFIFFSIFAFRNPSCLLYCLFWLEPEFALVDVTVAFAFYIPAGRRLV